MKKLYRVTIATSVMADNEEDARDAGAEWISTCDAEMMAQVSVLADVNERVLWLAKMSVLTTGVYGGWKERYAALKELYERRWKCGMEWGDWEDLMDAIDRYEATLMEEASKSSNSQSM